VESLRRRRVVDEAQLNRVRFICLEAGELYHAGRGAEDAIGTHSVVGVLLGNADRLVRFGLRD